MPLISRSNKLNINGDISDHSASLGSSRSKSVDSNEDLSYSGTISNPETDRKQSISGTGTTGSFSSARSKGSVSDSPGSGLVKDFPVKILGDLENLVGYGEGPLDVINELDIAQIEGRLPYIANEEVYISISTHGLQVVSSEQDVVLRRIPLHLIERLVTFDDGILGSTMLAVKTVQLNEICKEESTYSLFVFHCPTSDIGQKITQAFSHVLDSVLSSSSSNIETDELQIT